MTNDKFQMTNEGMETCGNIAAVSMCLN